MLLLPSARGDLVEVRGKSERRRATAQLEPRYHVESIVNSCVETRQARLLGDGFHSSTLAWEFVSENGAKRTRETGMSGRVRRVLRRREHGVDTRVCLRRPDEPVVVLGIEASDDRVEACRAHDEHEPCGLRVRAVV